MATTNVGYSDVQRTPAPKEIARAAVARRHRVLVHRLAAQDPHVLGEQIGVPRRQDAGAVVASASSVVAACSVLDRDDTDVVPSDLGMSGEDGYSLVRRIRAMPGAMASMPVIAMTAAVTEHHREVALSAGVDRHLTKPIDLDLLIASIAGLVLRWTTRPLPRPTLRSRPGGALRGDQPGQIRDGPELFELGLLQADAEFFL